MITRSFVLFLACSIYLLTIHNTIGVRVTPNIDEFMIENRRTKTRSRHNYMVQRAFDELPGNIDNLAPIPEVTDTETSPEEIANMIRNDIIYLDNSVETTTRKRGNIRKKNDVNIEKIIPPCTCMAEKDEMNLGNNYFPPRLDTWKCLKGACDTRCEPIYYWVIVLKKPKLRNEEFHPKWVGNRLKAPDDFHPMWELHSVNVTASCVCASPNDSKTNTYSTNAN